MSGTTDASEPLELDRRSFVGIAARTLAALAALPTASALLAGCGGGEEVSTPSASAPVPGGGAGKPDAAPAAPEPTPPAAAPAAPAPAETGGQALVTEIDAMRPTVQALQYVHQSTKPDQLCSNCLFYTAGEGGRGKCQLFTQGVVEEAGWCSSWSAKPTA